MLCQELIELHSINNQGNWLGPSDFNWWSFGRVEPRSVNEALAEDWARLDAEKLESVEAYYPGAVTWDSDLLMLFEK